MRSAGQEGRRPDRAAEQEHAPEASPVAPRPAEGRDEGPEVDRERHDPEEGDRRHVEGELVRDREQSERGGRREDEPPARAGAGPPPRFRFDLAQVFPRRHRRRLVHSRLREGRPCHEGSIDHEAARPEPRLRRDVESRLDEKRVGEEPQERPDVRDGVERIGRAAGREPDEPGLEQRTGRRERQVRKAGGDREQGEQPGERRVVGGRLPGRSGRERGRPGDGGRREAGDGEQDETEVKGGLPARPEPGREAVGIEVSPDEEDLEEEHARRPDRSPSAEPRQEPLRYERLNLEQKRGAEPDCRRDQESCNHPGSVVAPPPGRRGGLDRPFRGPGGGRDSGASRSTRQ